MNLRNDLASSSCSNLTANICSEHSFNACVLNTYDLGPFALIRGFNVHSILLHVPGRNVNFKHNVLRS